MHTHRTASRDCSLHLDGAPTVHCFHTSCAGAIEDANLRLRQAIGAAERGDNHATGSIRPRLTPEQKEHIRQKRIANALQARSAASLDTIKRDWSWIPERLVHDPEQGWRYLFTLFQPDDVLWIGDTYDTGKPAHRRHFATPSQWAEVLINRGVQWPLTCPSAFKPGTFSRCNEAVQSRRYLVVESDVLTKPEILAVFRWCRQFMRLRAIVDTAGRSLHGWFDYPAPDVIAELKLILPNLGCDPALFKPAQPCRLPGAPRNGRIQSLVWLDDGGQANV